MPRKALVCYMVDVFLFLAGLLCALSGFVLMAEGEGSWRGNRNSGISSAFSFSRHIWESVHEASGIAVTAGVIVHLWLHWRWVLQMTKALAKRSALKAPVCPPEERLKENGGGK